MKFLFSFLVVICLIPGTRKALYAQSVKDTLTLKSVLIEGYRITKNFHETRSDIDSIV